ncbi:hypothetical protein WS49_07185 [Burkholderia sp. RF7-non_BP4]|nr:hypothetical protein WS49_07185 [Burkholderia sp. RF7-non_BP4]
MLCNASLLLFHTVMTARELLCDSAARHLNRIKPRVAAQTYTHPASLCNLIYRLPHRAQISNQDRQQLFRC